MRRSLIHALVLVAFLLVYVASWALVFNAVNNPRVTLPRQYIGR